MFAKRDFGIALIAQLKIPLANLVDFLIRRFNSSKKLVTRKEKCALLRHMR